MKRRHDPEDGRGHLRLRQGRASRAASARRARRSPGSLTAKKADLDVGGYGTARNTTFEVLGRAGALAALDDLPAEERPRDRLPVPGVERVVAQRLRRRAALLLGGRRAPEPDLHRLLPHRERLPAVRRGRSTSSASASHGRFYGAWIDDKNIQPERPLDAVLVPALGRRVASTTTTCPTTSAGWSTRASSRTTSIPSTSRSSRRSGRTASSSRRPSSSSASGPSTATASSAPIEWADDQQNPDNQDRDDFLLQRMPQLHALGRAPAARQGAAGPRRLLRRRLHELLGEGPASATPSTRRASSTTCSSTPASTRSRTAQERDSEGRVFRPDGTVQLSDGQTLTDEEYVAQNPNATVLLKDGTVTTVAEVLATDPAALTDGSLDDFPPGPEGDGMFEEGELLNDRGPPHLPEPAPLVPDAPLGLRRGASRDRLPRHALRDQGAGLLEPQPLHGAARRAHAPAPRRCRSPSATGEALHILEPRMQWTRQ